MNGQRLKVCIQCTEPKPPEGGIDMSPTRWLCARCWKTFSHRRLK